MDNFSKEQQHFMMALTHELKTPIAVATLNLETLQKRKLEEPQQQKLIQNTLQEANRLNTLCNNMLLSSQIDASNYSLTNEDMNLSELVETSIAEYKNRFSSHQFIKNINENNFIIGDRMLLQIAVNNLHQIFLVNFNIIFLIFTPIEHILKANIFIHLVLLLNLSEDRNLLLKTIKSLSKMFNQ